MSELHIFVFSLTVNDIVGTTLSMVQIGLMSIDFMHQMSHMVYVFSFYGIYCINLVSLREAD